MRYTISILFYALQSLRCYASLWPPHVYPWKGIPLEGVWREGKRGRDVWVNPYTLALGYLLKETLVAIGPCIAQWAHPLRAWVSMGAMGPSTTGLVLHGPNGRAWVPMGPMGPSTTGLVFHGPVDGPLGQWAHPLNSCSTSLLVDGPIVTVGPSTE